MKRDAPMKIITVSGAHSGIGKTTLARELKDCLPGTTEVIKIGHGMDKMKSETLFHTTGEALACMEKLASMDTPAYLIIESNRILRKLVPDLSIYLTSESGTVFETGSAGRAKKKADIRLSRSSTRDKVEKKLKEKEAFTAEERRIILSVLEEFVIQQGR